MRAKTFEEIALFGHVGDSETQALKLRTKRSRVRVLGALKRPVSIETGLFLPPKYLNHLDRAREMSDREDRPAWLRPSRHIAVRRCGLNLATLESMRQHEPVQANHAVQSEHRLKIASYERRACPSRTSYVHSRPFLRANQLVEHSASGQRVAGLSSVSPARTY